MSIDITTDITTIQQNNSLSKQGQSTETPNSEMLKSVFVAVMQSSLTNRMFPGNTSIVDINIDIQDSSAEQKEQQNKKQDESPTQSERRDFTKEDKRTLNQSEIRHEQIADDYNRKIEQRENLQTEYKEKNERRNFVTNQPINSTTTSLEKTVLPVPISTGISIVPTDSVSATFSVLPESSNRQPATLQQHVSVPITPGVIPPSFLITASNPNSATTSPATSPFPVPTTNAASVTTLDAVSVMTIFTASGRFGIRKDETEEKNVAEKKKEKEKTKEKKETISLFVPVFVEIPPPIVYKNQSTHSLHDTEQELDTVQESNDYSVQKIKNENDLESNSELKSKSVSEFVSKLESEFESEFESETESETKSEPEENRTKTSLEKWFLENQSLETSVVKPNEPESFDQLRFIQRVAAACQSAANQHGTVRIKLHLDQLGTLTLRITSKSNKLAVRFEVTTFAAVRRLRETLDELQTTLAEQNIVLEHTEINMI
ncbi:MAG: flagellar hook-length control protein FliK [Planctomycetaceae bacterium]|jgi:hypothetical protein|nr:flagellar hook-length control protein FliK [Planctomycetaceae bacterium]